MIYRGSVLGSESDLCSLFDNYIENFRLNVSFIRHQVWRPCTDDEPGLSSHAPVGVADQRADSGH